MYERCKIDLQPIGRRISADYETTIFQAARDYGIGLASLCGGKGTCGKCKVRILSGEVSPLDDREKKSLSIEEIDQGYRLACMTRIYGNVKVEVPLESLEDSQRVHLAGDEKSTLNDPVVEIVNVHLSRPGKDDNRSDQVRVADYLAENCNKKDICVDLYAQRRLSTILRDDEWHAKICLHESEVIAAGTAADRVLGMAVDLGTTSIAAYLTDLETGEVLKAKGVMNPQIAYGEDIVSRISYTMENDGDTLRKVVVEGINKIIKASCAETGQSPDDIVEVVLVGNTAMHHLFLSLPVKQLIMAPYTPVVSGSLYTKARDIGLTVAPGAYVYTMPNIAGFVGADHVSMLLATGIAGYDKTVIGIDIGTNTEITLSANGKLSCCSCASGPAFEGAHIKNGMRAMAGAIEKVKINGDSVILQTIDDKPPIGLCGSGILDAAAQLLETGIINSKGRMNAHPCIRDSKNGKEFVLAGGDQSGTGKDITLTGKDLSEIQLAKGAIGSGMNILLDQAGVHWQDVEKVIIAGAFGNYIDVASAVRIGMLPPLALDRFSQVGNAAGVGAKQALISKSQRQMAMDIARRVNYVELTSFPGYPKIFAKALRFSPETNWKDSRG